MAKLTLDTITSSFASTTLFNTNFATILAELDGKVLYRNNTSGEANQMENDLDMNSNSILNADAINVTTLTVNGTPLTASTATTTTASAVTYDDSASVHTAVDVQEALDELGNASLATVQTSATDATVGRLMAVGAGGLLATSTTLIADADTMTVGQSGRVGSGTLSIPIAQNGVITYKAGFSSAVGTQVLEYTDSEAVYWRKKTGSTWSAWQPVYTGANLNPNVFGDSVVGGIVANGSMGNSGTAVFFLPISSPTAPVSITVTDTFNVADIVGTTITGGAGVTPVISVASSNKILVITVSGLTSTTDKPIILKKVLASSKITVNF